MIRMNRAAIGQIMRSPDAMRRVEDLAQKAIDGVSADVGLVAEHDTVQRRRAGLEIHPEHRQDAYKVAKHPELLMQALNAARR